MAMCPGAAEVGMAIPEHVEVRVCRDGMNWETVYSGPGEANGGRYDFAPRQGRLPGLAGAADP